MNRIKIACCGDSITHGLAASSPKKSYPSVLENILGSKFEIGNFGCNGATVIADFIQDPNHPIAYVKSPEYQQAKSFLPNVIVLMLGTNDASPINTFNKENDGLFNKFYQDLFVKTYKKIIEDLMSLSSAPKLYLGAVTPMRRNVCEKYNKNYIDHFRENLYVVRKLQEQVANECKLTLIDTQTGLDKAEYFADGCHLTDDGYQILAENINKSLTIIKGGDANI